MKKLHLFSDQETCRKQLKILWNMFFFITIFIFMINFLWSLLQLETKIFTFFYISLTTYFRGTKIIWFCIFEEVFKSLLKFRAAINKKLTLPALVASLRHIHYVLSLNPSRVPQIHRFLQPLIKNWPVLITFADWKTI